MSCVLINLHSKPLQDLSFVLVTCELFLFAPCQRTRKRIWIQLTNWVGLPPPPPPSPCSSARSNPPTHSVFIFLSCAVCCLLIKMLNKLCLRHVCLARSRQKSNLCHLASTPGAGLCKFFIFVFCYLLIVSFVCFTNVLEKRRKSQEGAHFYDCQSNNGNVLCGWPPHKALWVLRLLSHMLLKSNAPFSSLIVCAVCPLSLCFISSLPVFLRNFCYNW